jgi:2Fe-2S ferredoxin
MPTVTFIQPDGTEHVIVAETGESVMEAATRNGIDGIVAECGGGCVCGTCHVYLELCRLFDEPSELETDVLDGVPAERRENSRLACQLRLERSDMTVTVAIPDRQR